MFPVFIEMVFKVNKILEKKKKRSGSVVNRATKTGVGENQIEHVGGNSSLHRAKWSRGKCGTVISLNDSLV